MTKLLVSVRNVAEAEMACRSGVDLLDVKEPARGSLGAADSQVIEQVAQAVAGRLPLSVALGELREGAALPARLAGRVQYAKFGLAGCGECRDWASRWEAVIERLPRGVVPVGVVYADWQSAAAPEPSQVIRHAERLGCGAVLLDTFDKARGPLTHHFDWEAVGEFIAVVGAGGLMSVVAGGLGLAEIAALLPLAPDYIAVRGAACGGDRTSNLDEGRVRQLAALIHESAPRATTRSG